MTLVKQYFLCLRARVQVLDEEGGGGVAFACREYKATTDVCAARTSAPFVGRCQGSS